MGKPGRPQMFKPATVVAALQNAHGLKTGAAEILGVSFKAIDAYCQRYTVCQDVVDHWRKRRKDRSEYKLDEAIERGDPWAVMFTLKNAPDREYSDRYDVAVTGSLSVDAVVAVLEKARRLREQHQPKEN